MKNNENINYIIAKAIYDRRFDLPIWMYNLVTEDVIAELISIIPKNTILSTYKTNKYARFFFDKIESVLDNSKLPIYLIYNRDIDYCGILLNKQGWKILYKYLSTEFNYQDKIIDVVIGMSSDDDLSKKIPQFLKALKISYIDMVKTFVEKSNKPNLQSNQFRLINSIKANESIELTSLLLKLGVPVFFKNGDATDLYNYLSTILNVSWYQPIDDNISKIKITVEENESITELLYKIFVNINTGIITNAKRMLSYDDFETVFGKTYVNLMREGTGKVYGIKDFNELINLIGENGYGLPIWVQKQFIKNDGNIKTMFTDSGLVPEASIFRSINEMEFLIDSLSIESINFLIYNSVEFVKNIIKRPLLPKYCIKIAKALFENPINLNLWGLLNAPNKSNLLDFRANIVNNITVTLTLEGLFFNVPESMMYISPGALYVTRNLRNANIPFIPITKLIPVMITLVSSNDYIKFNRFYNGKIVSLLDVMNPNMMKKYITDYGKYGYLGDIGEEECVKLLGLLSEKE